MCVCVRVDVCVSVCACERVCACVSVCLCERVCLCENVCERECVCMRLCVYEIIPDRIEAGTIMIAGAITGGSITLENDASCYLASVVDKLRETGVEIKVPDASKNTPGRVKNGECIVKKRWEHQSGKYYYITVPWHAY